MILISIIVLQSHVAKLVGFAHDVDVALRHGNLIVIAATIGQLLVRLLHQALVLPCQIGTM